MAKCEVCQKDMFFGRKIRITRSQISRRALTTQQANVHRVKVVVDGTPKSMNVCTRFFAKVVIQEVVSYEATSFFCSGSYLFPVPENSKKKRGCHLTAS